MAALVVVIVGLSTATAAPASAQASPALVEVTDGFVLLRSQAQGGALTSSIEVSGGPRQDAARSLVLWMPSVRFATLAEGDAMAWLGEAGAPRWRTAMRTTPWGTGPLLFTSGPTAASLGTDKEVTLSISDVVGPGAMSLYKAPYATDDGAPEAPRVGTGAQRDGSPQGSGPVTVPAGGPGYQQASFTASGIYCATLTWSAQPAGAPERQAATVPVRFAVGDTVATDAPCGTATGEDGYTYPPVDDASRGYFLNAGLDVNGEWLVGLGQSSASWLPDTAQVTLRVGPDRRYALPAYEPYGWLGGEGEVGWHAGTASDTPATAAAANLSLSTAAAAPGSLAADASVDVEITVVEGPGELMTYALDGDQATHPPTTTYALGTGATRSGAPRGAGPVGVAPGTVTTPMWRFTEPGMYCVTYQASTVLADGTEVSDDHTLRWAVGATVAANAPCGAAGTDPKDGPALRTPWDQIPSEAHIIDGGHTDVLFPQVDTAADGTSTAHLRLRDGDLGTVEWDDAIFVHSDAAKMTLPGTYTETADYSFIAPEGATVWNSPRTQVVGLPWLGVESGDPSLSYLANPTQAIHFRLDAVTGPAGAPAPGEMVVWEHSSEDRGDKVYYSTRKGLPNGRGMGSGGHGHYNWTATAPGVYCLAFSVDVPLPDGTRGTDREQLTLVYGDEVDASQVVPCGLTQPYPDDVPRQAFNPGPGDVPVVSTATFTSLDLRLQEGQLRASWREEDPYQASRGHAYDLEELVVHRRAYTTADLEEVEALTVRDTFVRHGWDATEVRQEDVAGDITWDLSEVTGPGTVKVTRSLPTIPVFDTGAATPLGSYAVWPGYLTHTSNWTFSTPGRYCLTMRWSVPLAAGGTATTEKTLTWLEDGPVDPDQPFTTVNGVKVYEGPLLSDDPANLERCHVPDAERLVRELYRVVLGRGPDAAGLTYWADRLEAGVAPEVLANTLARTREGYRRVVTHAYQQALGRTPEPGGLQYWTDHLVRTRRPDLLLIDLLASREAWTTSGGTAAEWVDDLYRKVLDRGPEAAGARYWTDRVERGRASGPVRRQAANAFLRTPEADHRAVGRAALAACDGLPAGDRATLVQLYRASSLNPMVLRAAVVVGGCTG